MGSYGEMALRKLSNADDGAFRLWVELIAGPELTDAPVAATTLAGRGGSLKPVPWAAPASTTGPMARVPAIELFSSGLVSSANKVGWPRSEERRVGKECRCRWWAYV